MTLRTTRRPATPHPRCPKCDEPLNFARLRCHLCGTPYNLQDPVIWQEILAEDDRLEAIRQDVRQEQRALARGLA